MLLPREFAQHLGQMLAGWRERITARAEFARLDPATAERIQAETGIGAADIRTARAGSLRDIGRMMRHFGIRPEQVPGRYLRAVRDAERTCARCDEAKRCHRWLDGKTTATDAPRLFCPNASLFDEITAAARAGEPTKT